MPFLRPVGLNRYQWVDRPGPMAPTPDFMVYMTKERYDAELAKARREGSLDSGPQAEYLKALEEVVDRIAMTAVTAEERDRLHGIWLHELCGIRDSHRGK